VIEGAKALCKPAIPQDHEFVVNFSDAVTFGLPECPFTSNLEDLRAALRDTPASGKTDWTMPSRPPWNAFIGSQC